MRAIATLLFLACAGVVSAQPGSLSTDAEPDELIRLATSGDSEAQAGLATRYLLGEATRTDHGSGYFWALVAYASGHGRGPGLIRAVEDAIDDAQFQRIVRERAASWRPGARGMPYAAGVVAYVPPLPPHRTMPPFEVIPINDAVVVAGPTAEYPDAAWTLLLAQRPVAKDCADGSVPQRETCVVVTLDSSASVLAARLHADVAFAFPTANIQATVTESGARLQGSLSMSGAPAEVSPSVAFDLQFDIPLMGR